MQACKLVRPMKPLQQQPPLASFGQVACCRLRRHPGFDCLSAGSWHNYIYTRVWIQMLTNCHHRLSFHSPIDRCPAAPGFKMWTPPMDSDETPQGLPASAYVTATTGTTTTAAAAAAASGDPSKPEPVFQPPSLQNTAIRCLSRHLDVFGRACYRCVVHRNDHPTSEPAYGPAHLARISG